ncbi:MAG: hypothetical protein IPK83_04610 [Planctomycetes bacterium]|nr:hypothetical protein [Planctomycetota bacterium]
MTPTAARCWPTTTTPWTTHSASRQSSTTRSPARRRRASRGLYYYGYRYYGSRWGRWTNHDPIGEGGGLHSYAMTMNDVINGIDYLGLQSATPITPTTTTPYSAPPVSLCGGSFTVCPRNDIVVPHYYTDRNGVRHDNTQTRTTLDLNGMNPDAAIGFEVQFTKSPDCCCDNIRLVQAIKRASTAGIGGQDPHIDGQAKGFTGRKGDYPAGMGLRGRTGNSESFVDAPLAPANGKPSFEVCAICVDSKGKETNLGCVTFAYIEGSNQNQWADRGIDFPIEPAKTNGGIKLVQTINGTKADCFRKTAMEPGDLWKRGMDDWKVKK